MPLRIQALLFVIGASGYRPSSDETPPASAIDTPAPTLVHPGEAIVRRAAFETAPLSLEASQEVLDQPEALLVDQPEALLVDGVSRSRTQSLESFAFTNASGRPTDRTAISKPPSSAPVNNAAQDIDGVAAGDNAAELFTKALKQRNLQALHTLLQEVRDVNSASHNVAFDIGSNFVPLLVVSGNSTSSPGMRLGLSVQSPEIRVKVNMVAAAAAEGWLPGLGALLDWVDQEQSAARHLESDGAGGTPLLHSVRAGHAPAAEMLLDRRASPFTPDSRTGETPLEAAARSGAAPVVAALLRNSSELTSALAPLRARLLHRAVELPNIVLRWPVGPIREDGMDKMRSTIPKVLFPRDTARALVGERPLDWLTLYAVRVMHALADSARSANSTSADVDRVASVLKENQYDVLTRSFSWSVVGLGLMLGVTGILAFVVFRLRVFGPCEMPVSMAHMLPGAFEPIRVADPDFDPGRNRIKLPYRLVRDRLAPFRCAVVCKHGICTFLRALFGVFCAWLLQFVRIPPENDIYDEDYASDDDEESRLFCRMQCTQRAKLVRDFEVVLRNALFGFAVWWTVFHSRRWELCAACFFAYTLHAIIASAVAVSIAPAPVPEMTPHDGLSAEADGGIDSARVVYALFGVQYGKRWTRSIATTRSTATMSRSRMEKRRQRRRRGERGDRGRSPSDAIAEGVASEVETADNTSHRSASETAAALHGAHYSDIFQRSFLQVGLMHTPHRDYLVRSVFCMTTIYFTLLYVVHLGPLLGMLRSCWADYSRMSPEELFAAYGAADSGKRMIMVAVEVLLLSLAVERLCAITDLLNVAALTLQQRRRSLAFAVAHPPPKERIDSHVWRREAALCVEFAMELSDLRWPLLRYSVFLCLCMLLKLLSLVFALETAKNFAMFSSALMHVRAQVDPLALLFLSLCFFWPVFAVLYEGASSNRELRYYIEKLRADGANGGFARGDSPRSSSTSRSGSGTEPADRKTLGMLTWPGGREVGFLEPCLLVLFAAAAFAATARNLYSCFSLGDVGC